MLWLFFDMDYEDYLKTRCHRQWEDRITKDARTWHFTQRYSLFYVDISNPSAGNNSQYVHCVDKTSRLSAIQTTEAPRKRFFGKWWV